MPSLGRFIRHQSQWNDKFQVHLQIHTAFGVKVSSPSAQFFVQFKRGDHKGSTMKLNSTDPHSIAFDSSCSFTFPCTLYYFDVSKKNYEEKIVTVYFNEESSSDPTAFITHGKSDIDLAKYAKEVPLNASKSFPLTEVLSKPKKGDALRLQVTLTITCECVNDPSKSEVTTETTPQVPPSSTLPPSSQPSTSEVLPTPTTTPTSTPLPTPTATPSQTPVSSPLLHRPSAPIHIPAGMVEGREEMKEGGGGLVRETSVSALGNESRARSDDGESVSSISSRNSPPSPSSISPSSSPPRYSTSFEAGSHGSGGSNPRSLSSSSSTSNIKSYLHSPPVKMHLLERRDSDSLLNTSDIAMRLASKHPELCKAKGDGTTTPTTAPTTPTTTSRMDSLRASHEHSPRSRRAIEFKNEGRIKSSNDLKSPMLQRALQQKQKDDERYLIEEIIPMPPCFSNGVPILAYVLFRALLRWRSFHPNNSQFFDSLFASFNNLNSITPSVDFVSVLLYRFFTAVALLHMLQTELQILSSDNVSVVLKDFSRRLKKSLMSFNEVYYSNVKEDLNPAIKRILANVKEGMAEAVIPVFEKHLKLVSASILVESLRQQIIYQIFYYFNARMFNSLLEHMTPCQCAVGLGLKMLVLHIENWASSKNETTPLSQSASEVVQLQSDSMLGWVYNSCRRALSGMRQAADVLVVKKSTLIEQKIRAEVCPSLTPQQLLILLESYAPDEFDPEPMHPGVIKSINDEMPPENITYQAPPTLSSPLLDTSAPSSLNTHFTQPLSLTSLSIPSAIINHPSFTFLRDVCTDSNNTQW